MSVPAALKFTYEDYCLLPEDRRYEVIDGEVFVTPAPTTMQQVVKGRLKRLIEDFVQPRQIGLVLDAPYDVVLSKFDVLQPDILFVSTERRSIIGAKHAGPAPDLVIEVLSPSTERRDRVVKAKRYAMFGVREMWLVDPDGKTIEVLVNTEDGFRRKNLYAEGDTAHSSVLPGFECRVAQIFQAY